jgi:hypothetical protein
MQPVLTLILVFGCSVFTAKTGPPKIYSPDGTFLGNLSNNPIDPNSVYE